MARISIEDCLDRIPNRFALVHLAAQRARQLSRGSSRTIECENKNIVTSLREVAGGKISFEKELNETTVVQHLKR